jgi:hypothetical protein
METRKRNHSFLCCGLIRTGKIFAIIDAVLTVLTIAGLFYVLKVRADNSETIQGQVIRLHNEQPREQQSLLFNNQQKQVLRERKLYNENVYIGLCFAMFFTALHLMFCVLFLFGASKVRKLLILSGA